MSPADGGCGRKKRVMKQREVQEHNIYFFKFSSLFEPYDLLWESELNYQTVIKEQGGRLKTLTLSKASDLWQKNSSHDRMKASSCMTIIQMGPTILHMVTRRYVHLIIILIVQTQWLISNWKTILNLIFRNCVFYFIIMLFLVILQICSRDSAVECHKS